MIPIWEKEPNKVGKDLKGKHFVFYGKPGTWKTTVANDFPNTITAAFDVGYGMIPGVIAQNITSYTDMKNLIAQLENPLARKKFDHVCLDGLPIFDAMTSEYTCQKKDVASLGDVPHGGGWGENKKNLMNAIHKIAQLGYGLIFITHVKIKEKDGAISYTPELGSQMGSIVQGLADFVVYANKEMIDPNGDPNDAKNYTVMAYTHLGSVDGKSRSRHLDTRFEFTHANLSRVVRESVERLGDDVTVESFKPHEVVDGISFQDMKDAILGRLDEISKTDNVDRLNKAIKSVTNILGSEVKLSDATTNQSILVKEIYENVLGTL